MADAASPVSTPYWRRRFRFEGEAIAEDMPCAVCDYNLRTLGPQASCPECGKQVDESLHAQWVRTQQRVTLRDLPTVTRIGYVVFGIALPGLGLWIASIFSGFTWPPDSMHDWCRVLFNSRGTVWFLPLVLYAMMSLWLVVIQPLTTARTWQVRLGVYGGIVLAAQYVLAYVVLWFHERGLIWGAAVVAAVVATSIAGNYAASKISGRHARRVGGIELLLLLAGGVCAAVFVPALALAPVVLALLGLPIWALFTYTLAAMRIFRTYDEDGSRGMPMSAVVSWLAAYAATWTVIVMAP